MPLYGCKSYDDAQFIIARVASRREKEDQIRKQEAKEAVEQLETVKKMTGLDRRERRKLHSGDKSIMYEKMGLVNESDIDKYRRKIGLKHTVEDLLGKTEEEID